MNTNANTSTSTSTNTNLTSTNTSTSASINTSTSTNTSTSASINTSTSTSSGTGTSTVTPSTSASSKTATSDLARRIKASLDGNVTHVGHAVRTPGLLYPELSHNIVGAAIEVHRRLGPGQLEAVYQRALGKELAFRQIPARAQVPIAMRYRGEPVGEFFADFIVDGKIVVELKAVERVHGAHKAQVISYLRATGLKLGLLVNFNVALLYRGVTRLVV